tara:strand:+ start:2046 stop:2168 length:123 start_codon:yes stop_codon:yes gene_type:complete
MSIDKMIEDAKWTVDFHTKKLAEAEINLEALEALKEKSND